LNFHYTTVCKIIKAPGKNEYFKAPLRTLNKGTPRCNGAFWILCTPAFAEMTTIDVFTLPKSILSGAGRSIQQGFPVFFDEMFFRKTDFEKVPGQELVQISFAIDIEIGIDVGFSERLHPVAV